MSEDRYGQWKQGMPPMKGLRGLLLLAIVSLKAIAGSLNTDERKSYFNIESQPMVEALNEWAQQSGLQIIVPENEKTSSLISPPLEGRFSPQRALELMLVGTSLPWSYINPRTIAIGPTNIVGIEPLTSQATVERPASPYVDQYSFNLRPERVTVSAPRLLGDSLSIRVDAAHLPAALRVIDQKQIAERGVATVGELLKYLSQQPHQQSSLLGNVQHVDLRGLGPNATAVLINGYPAPPSAASVSSAAVDLDTLPLAAVDRVEVLTESVPAMYGSSAVGGVVNIILKRDVPKPGLDLRYGAAAGGADERRLSLNAGRKGSGWNVSAVLDHFERTPLKGESRDLWSNQDYRPFGGQDWRVTTAQPANVRSLTGENLPGLPSTFASVPVGSTGFGLTTADFLGTAGTQNKYSFLRDWYIIPESQRNSAWMSADIELNAGLEAFADLLYVRRHDVQGYSFNMLTVTVPAANPTNPFGVDVAADYLFAGLDPVRRVQDSRLYRAVAGLRGRWNRWHMELVVLRTDDRSTASTRNEVDPVKVAAALASTDFEKTLNVFADGPGGSAALLEGLLSKPTVDKYVSNATQGSAVMRGPLFNLPAGEATATAGVEALDAGIIFHQGSAIEPKRTSAALFGEVSLPLLSRQMSIPAVESLQLKIAGRYDRHNDVGDTFNPQYGLLWSPVESTQLSASYSTSFRAPSLYELYAARSILPGVQVVDARRGGDLTAVSFIVGGNPDLRSTVSRSWAFDIAYSPSEIDGLKLSAKYWQIDMSQRVGVVPYFVMASNEDLFRERVIRDEPTAEDIASGLPGRLLAFDISQANYGRLSTCGIDWLAAYAADTRIGRLSTDISATSTLRFETADIPGSSPISRLDVASQLGTVTRWRTIATVGWSRDGLQASTTVRYTAGYQDATSLGQPTGRRIPAQTLVDLQGTVAFDELFTQSRWAGMTLSVGMSNLFDREPSFASIGGAYGHDLTQADPRQRFGYLKFSVVVR